MQYNNILNYDVFQLLESDRVTKFIGSKQYHEHKQKRFRQQDEPDITKNEAFWLSNQEHKNHFKEEYQRTFTLYYQGEPSLEEMLARIQSFAERL